MLAKLVTRSAYKRGLARTLATSCSIVRGADTPAKDLTPESRGLEAIADGFRRIYDDDHQQLDAESVVYDALYAYCQESVRSWLHYPADYEFGFTWFKADRWALGNRRSICWTRTDK